MNLGIMILAGGSGRRFGGDKAFYKLGEKTMIEHAFDRISQLSEEIAISCRSNREKLAEMFPSAKVIGDKWDRRGPLTGLVSALPSMKSIYVAVITCDCPEIKPEVIKLLARRAGGHDGAVPRWPDGYVEPLQAVYHRRKLAMSTEAVWKDGEMKVTKVLEKLPDLIYVSTDEIRKVDPKLESFLNINRLDDVLMLKDPQKIETG